MTTTTIPTMTVRLDLVEGLIGWTVQLTPATPDRPAPILTVADADGTVQAARRVHGLEDAELEPVIDSVPGTNTGTLVDLLVPIDVLDPALREGAGITATDLAPRTARRLAQRALEMHTIRAVDAEEASRPPSTPAPAPSGPSGPSGPSESDAESDDAAWDF